MTIQHKVTFFEQSAEAELKSLGIVTQSRHLEFTMTEDDPRWTYVSRMISEHDVLDVVETSFTDQELQSAELLTMNPAWHWGYPQPEKQNGFLSATYDLTDYCERCAIGLRQNAPFRFKSEPKWGRRSILQLNWVFDEFFVTPDAWLAVFKRFGIRSREVLEQRSGSILQTVVQLDVRDMTPCNLDLHGYPSQTCEVCGQRKYLPITRGAFPRLACEWLAGTHIAKSIEYFGAGAKSYAEVIVTQELYRAILDARLSGVSFWPLQGPS